MGKWFQRFADRVSRWAGSPWAFGAALALVLGWVVVGFFVGFTGTFYQLIINTGTTIVTFLMVFLIQATQNRDAQAWHAKLDELVRDLPEVDERRARARAEEDPDKED